MLKATEITNIQKWVFPLFMGLKDSLFIVNDMASSPHFHVYKTPKFEYMGSFGLQGKGPSDLQDPTFWGQFKNVAGAQKIGVFQMNTMKFSWVDVHEALKSNSYQPTETFIMPPEVGTAVNIIALNDSVLVGTGIEANGEFFKYNLRSRAFEWRNFIKDGDDNFNHKISAAKLESEYHMGFIKVKPDNNMFVKAYVHHPTIDVYDSEANLLFTIKHKEFALPEIDEKQKQFKGNSKIYFANVFLSDKYIYALNLNCTLKEQAENTCSSPEIEVYDWSGKAICKFQLSGSTGNLSPFVVDELHKRIYTINPKMEYDSFQSYQIDHF
ncbi:BF3164 family lipoprotein [Pelobium manganitolerans]|uniref:BF3164 family lipoprotein n=1 Tax=Pelobium manganitolerans TaxID=1842495 RepID=UPI003FA352B5